MTRLRLLLFVLAICLKGQQTVGGVVEDPSGAPVFKAKITLRGAASGEIRAAATGEDGRFVFEAVTDGDYALQAVVKQMEPLKKSVKVAGARVELKLKMKVETRSDSVEVTTESSKVAESTVSSERNADRLNFQDEVLDSLPAQGQDALSVVSTFLSPAAQGAEGVSVTINGIESNSSTLPASAIRRVRVNRNPYALEFRRPGKARLEAYTEEGSMRRYRGAFGIAIRNSIFDARNTFAPVRPDMTRTLIDLSLSGPLSKQKSSFYVNGEYFSNNETAVVNAQTLTGPVLANVLTPERRTRFLGQYERRGELHQTTAQYSFFDQSEENRGVGGLRLAEQGAPASERIHRTQFSDRVLLFGKVLNDFRIVFQREETERGVITSSPAIQVHGAFTGGPSQTYRLRRETSVRIQNIASLTTGRHNLRFGMEARPAFFDSVERSNFGGTYEFADLEAFEAGRALQFRVNRGDPNVGLGQHEAFAFIQDEITLARVFSVTYGARYSWQSDVQDYNNVAPRIGFAYSPGGGKTVIRGGAGVFHERVSEEVNRRALLFDGVRMREAVFQNVRYPLDAEAVEELPAPSVSRRSGLVSPVLVLAGVGVEREIWKRTTLAAEYQHMRGSHLLRSRDANAPVNGLRPDASYLNVNQVESSGAMRSDGLTITLRGAAGKWTSGMLQYVLSRTQDDTAGPFALPANSYNLRPEWGRAEQDRLHRMNAAATLNLPSGFRFGAFLSLASGAPYNITTGRDDNGDTNVNDRPAGIGRNVGLGPGLARVDLRFTKLLRSPRLLDRGRKHTSRNLEISLDAFNLFNHANLATYVGVMTSPFFGTANAALAPRTIQISLRYKF